MKKLIAFLLCFAMTAIMSVTAFAAKESDVLTNESQNKDIDVNVTYRDGSASPDVYSVDIQWENMTFTYNEAGTKQWNPATHEYENSVTGSWEKSTADITVTNHSNKSVNVTVSYHNNNQIGISAAVTNGTFAIESAVGKAVDAAELTKTATLTVSGTPTDKTADNLKVGIVAVTIA